MSNMIISKVTPHGEAGGGGFLPLHTVTLDYAKINAAHTDTHHNTGKKRCVVEARRDVRAKTRGRLPCGRGAEHLPGTNGSVGIWTWPGNKEFKEDFDELTLRNRVA